MKVIKLVMPLTETLPKDGLIPPKMQPSLDRKSVV